MPILEAKCRKCRRAGEKLFLKGERCYSVKCPLLRKPYAPGMHRRKVSRFALSEYGQQLLEKQKAKLIYGLNEAQLRRYFREALKSKEATDEVLFKKLELRLDNVVFRLGFASSRRGARQLISHGHILVNDRKVTIPSFHLKKGDIIKIRPQSLNKAPFKNLANTLKKYQPPTFLSLDAEKLIGKVISEPSLKELTPTIDFSQIVEFYAK